MKEFKPEDQANTSVYFSRPSTFLGESGMQKYKGLEISAFNDDKEILIVPLVDREKPEKNLIVSRNSHLYIPLEDAKNVVKLLTQVINAMLPPSKALKALMMYEIDITNELVDSDPVELDQVLVTLKAGNTPYDDFPTSEVMVELKALIKYQGGDTLAEQFLTIDDWGNHVS